VHHCQYKNKPNFLHSDLRIRTGLVRAYDRASSKEGYVGVSPQLDHHTSRLRFLQFTSTRPDSELPLTSFCRELVIARCTYSFKYLGVASGRIEFFRTFYDSIVVFTVAGLAW
jgi:hypothetical protein